MIASEIPVRDLWSTKLGSPTVHAEPVRLTVVFFVQLPTLAPLPLVVTTPSAVPTCWIQA